MNGMKKYRIMLFLILLLLVAALGFYVWSIYGNEKAPEDGTLVQNAKDTVVRVMEKVKCKEA